MLRLLQRRSASRTLDIAISGQVTRNERDSELQRAPESIALPSATRLCNLLCKESHMATNLSVDPDLIEEALKVSGERTVDAINFDEHFLAASHAE